MKYHMKQQKELIGQLVGENSEIFLIEIYWI
jgi:hypothetical protein